MFMLCKKDVHVIIPTVTAEGPTYYYATSCLDSLRKKGYMRLRHKLRSSQDTQSPALLESSQNTGIPILINKSKSAKAKIIISIAVVVASGTGAILLQELSTNNNKSSLASRNVNTTFDTRTSDYSHLASNNNVPLPDPSAYLNSLQNFNEPLPPKDADANKSTDSTNTSLTVNGQTMDIPVSGTTTQTITNGGGRTNVTITTNQSTSGNGTASSDVVSGSTNHTRLRVTTQTSSETNTSNSTYGASP
jgi:hypothetical protein